MDLIATITAAGATDPQTAANWKPLTLTRCGQPGMGYPQLLRLFCTVVGSNSASGDLWCVLYDKKNDKCITVIKFTYTAIAMDAAPHAATGLEFAATIADPAGRQTLDLLGAQDPSENTTDSYQWYIGHGAAFPGGVTAVKIWGKATSEI